MTDFPYKRGEFNVLRKIGEGGMAEVFLAERGGDEGFRTRVALKRLHSGFALDQYFIRQLVQEAKLLGQLQHNNIVRVHDLRKIDDEYFIVMEYIDGIDLAQAIYVHTQHALRFPLSIFFHVALSLCEALEFAHTAVDLEGQPIQLIHRDIKPSNVLIHHRGVVKLTDFGIARVGDSSNTGSVVKGTANYMSPEQASGDEQLSPSSDIFSLGAVFWEMLTLEKLVDGTNYLNVIHAIKELNVGLKDISRKGIEPGLRMILLRMLARKRELRYQSMGLVLKDLRFVAEQMKVDLSPSHLRQYMAKITNLARQAAPDGGPPVAPSPVPGSEAEEGSATPPPVAAEPTPPRGVAVPPEPSPPTPAEDTGLDESTTMGPASSEEPSLDLDATQGDPDATHPDAPSPVAPPVASDPGPVSGGHAPAQAGAIQPPKPLIQRNTGTDVRRATSDLRRDLEHEELTTSPGSESGRPPQAASERPPDSFTGPSDNWAPGSQASSEETGEHEVWDYEDDYYESQGRLRLPVIVSAGLGLLVLGIVVAWGLSSGDRPAGSDGSEVLPRSAMTTNSAQPANPPEASAGDAELPPGPDEDPALASSEEPVAPPGTDRPSRGSSPDEAEVREVEEVTPYVRETRASRSEEEPTRRRRSEERSKRADEEKVTVRASSRSEDSRRDEEPSRKDTRVDIRVRGAGSEDSSDDWATADEDESGDMGEGTDMVAPLTRESINDMKDGARRGALSGDQVDQLEDIQPGTSNYNRSRAVLLAHYENSGDRKRHCSTAEEVLGFPQNRADPQFNLEMAKCHLRSGRFKSALDHARTAELHAQDIPSRIRTERQLLILEIQAKSYKGLYQRSDNLDRIDDAIAVWKRYRSLAENTHKGRKTEKASKRIRELVELKDGAL